MEDQEIAQLEKQIEEMKFREEETEKKFWQERVVRKHEFLLKLIKSLPSKIKPARAPEGYLIQKFYLTEKGYRLGSEEVALSQLNTVSSEQLQALLGATEAFLNKVKAKLKEHKRENMEKIAKF